MEKPNFTDEELIIRFQKGDETAFTELVNSNLAEYPMQLKSLAWDITKNHILMNNDGLINIPSDIGHGMIINEDALKKYKVDVEIRINNEKVF